MLQTDGRKERENFVVYTCASVTYWIISDVNNKNKNLVHLQMCRFENVQLRTETFSNCLISIWVCTIFDYPILLGKLMGCQIYLSATIESELFSLRTKILQYGSICSSIHLEQKKRSSKQYCTKPSRLNSAGTPATNFNLVRYFSLVYICCLYVTLLP